MSKEKFLKLYAPLLLVLLSVVIPVMVFASSGEATHGASAKLWKELLFKTMNFVVMIAALYFLLAKPAKNFFMGRRNQIKQSFSDLNTEKDDIEKKYEEYKNRLASLDKEAENIIQEFVADGEREKQKIVEEAHHAAKMISEQAESTIKLEIALAKKELINEISEVAVNMAEDLMQKNITKSDQKVLVDEFLMKVVEVK